MKRSVMFIVAASALALTACNTQTTGGNASAVAEGTGLGITPAWMDKSVKAGDDFFSYADGSWVKNTEIPADRSRIGGFYIADQEREKNTRALFDEIMKSNPTSGPNAM